MTIKVLFHSRGTKHCPDGFTAATVAYKKFGKTAQYIPVEYQNGVDNYREYLWEKVNPQSEDEVYILDWSAPRPVIILLEMTVKSLVILDHHKTAQEQLLGLKFAVFDMSQSGARLTWEYFFPGQPVPNLIRYVEDRDLWKKELILTEEVHRGLSVQPQEFEHWLNLMDDANYVQNMYRVGFPLLMEHKRKVDEWIKHYRVGRILNRKVAILKTTNTSLVSDGLNLICLRNRDLDFAAAWQYKDGILKWEFRCTRDVNVGKIARTFGGGGHNKASGYSKEVKGIQKLYYEIRNWLRI